MGRNQAKANQNDFFQQYLVLQAEESKNFRTMMLAMMGKQNNPKGDGANAEDTPVSPAKWDANQVKKFLEENGFQDVSETFLANDIDGPTFLHLDRESLQLMGITNALQQSRLLGKIATLRAL